MAKLGIAALSILLCACPSNPTQPGSVDNSPPEFLQVSARLEDAATGQVRADLDLNGPDDVIRTGIGSDLALRIIATAGDAQTGITNMTVLSELRWRCQIAANSQGIGIIQTAPVAFDAFTQPAAPLTPMQINLRSNPIAQTGCPRAAGRGPVFISGFVRVTATNGAATTATATSMTFIFDYEDALGPATGTRLDTGQSSDTPYMAECRKRGVPIPPDWSINSTAWVRHGNLRDDGANQLQGSQADATVWTFTHPRVRGACIALPRGGGGGGRAGLAGIICQGAATGNACFWDSRLRNDANPDSDQPAIDWASQVLRIARLKDATNIHETDSGKCPTCHRGNNVFLIAPDAPTWASVLRDKDLGPTFTTRVDNSADTQGGKPRYIPVTGVFGRARTDMGWTNDFMGTGCGAACHEQTGGGFTPMATFPMPAPCARTGAQQNIDHCYRY